MRGKGRRTWKPLIEAGPLSLFLHEVRGTEQGGWGGEGRRFKERRSELVILESEKVSDSGLPGSQGTFLRHLAKHLKKNLTLSHKMLHSSRKLPALMHEPSVTRRCIFSIHSHYSHEHFITLKVTVSRARLDRNHRRAAARQ